MFRVIRTSLTNLLVFLTAFICGLIAFQLSPEGRIRQRAVDKITELHAKFTLHNYGNLEDFFTEEVEYQFPKGNIKRSKTELIESIKNTTENIRNFSNIVILSSYNGKHVQVSVLWHSTFILPENKTFDHLGTNTYYFEEIDGQLKIFRIEYK